MTAYLHYLLGSFGVWPKQVSDFRNIRFEHETLKSAHAQSFRFGVEFFVAEPVGCRVFRHFRGLAECSFTLRGVQRDIVADTNKKPHSREAMGFLVDRATLAADRSPVGERDTAVCEKRSPRGVPGRMPDPIEEIAQFVILVKATMSLGCVCSENSSSTKRFPALTSP